MPQVMTVVKLTMNSKELLELIDNNTIVDIMSDLGSPCYGVGTTSDGGGYLKFKTICHHGDSTKLWYYENSKSFYCYTCCGSLSLFDLIIKVNSCNFSEAFVYVAGKLGIKLSSERYGINDTQNVRKYQQAIDTMDDLIESKKPPNKLVDITKFYDDKILQYFDNETFYDGWINEGISINTMQKYEISYYWLENHIIIPHRNQQGQLVGIRRRSLKPEDSRNKYMPLSLQDTTYAHALNLNLYGLHLNKKRIEKEKTAILVEGEKSVMLADTYYDGPSLVVATCGFNVSDWQIRALTLLGVNKIYLAFDKDFDITKEAQYMEDKTVWNDYLSYKRRMEALTWRLQREFCTKVIYDRENLLDKKDSPLDKGKDVFEELKKNAKPLRTSITL